MNKLLKLFFMIVPAICFAVAIYLLTDFSYNKSLEVSPVFNYLLSSADASARDNQSGTFNGESDTDLIIPMDLPDGIEYTDDELPVIKYGSKWAILNIDGWKKDNIPVYFGDSNEILTKGAGQWIGSFFCGLGKNCVISAHVMTWFYEIEDTEIGTELLMQTIYGTYKYEVTDKFIFNENEAEVLYNDYGFDTLLLYTCYPRSGGLTRTQQRAMLVCTLKEGRLYKNKYE